MVGYSSLLFGQQGLELAYSSELRSRRDLTISDLISVILGRDLRPLNLQLTIDAELQRLAYQALGGQRGAVVALNPATGEVLAMVSTPSYDPALLLGTDAADQWQALLDDPNRPLADRATRELYPPGSTFKTVVATAAIENGVATPETTFPDPAEFPLPGSTATDLQRRRRRLQRRGVDHASAGLRSLVQHDLRPPRHRGRSRVDRRRSPTSRVQPRDPLPLDGRRLLFPDCRTERDPGRARPKRHRRTRREGDPVADGAGGGGGRQPGLGPRPLSGRVGSSTPKEPRSK